MTIEKTENTVAEKVLQLTIERNQTKDRKKATMAAYNEEIKRIEAEIRDLINPKKKKEDLLEDADDV
jgi:hypothetical protein